MQTDSDSYSPKQGDERQPRQITADSSGREGRAETQAERIARLKKSMAVHSNIQDDWDR